MKKSKLKKESLSRFFAIQILFSYFYDKNENINDLKSFIEEYFISNIFEKDEYQKNINNSFLEELLTKTIENISKIDSILKKEINTEKFTFDNIDNLIKIIFRLALYEFIFTKTEKKIIINEYVDISSEYYDNEKTVAFVNANLDKLSKIDYDKI